jgi:hypothetical protein
LLTGFCSDKNNERLQKMKADRQVFELPEGIEIHIRRDGKVLLVTPDVEGHNTTTEHDISETPLGTLLSKEGIM